jgi:hypothetical protein
MRKSELEKARKAYGSSFKWPTTMDTAAGQAVVQADVKPAQDAYSAIGMLVEQLTATIQRGGLELREQAQLAKTLKDLTSALVQLRAEGRATAGAMTNEQLLDFIRGLVEPK